MARKKDSLSVFEDTLNKLGYSNPEIKENVTSLDDVLDNEQETDIDDIDDNPVNKTEENKEVDPELKEDNTEIPEGVFQGKDQENKDGEKNDTEEQTEEEEIEDITEEESSQVGAFFDAFAESLGWDVSDEERPDSIEGLISYIQQIVEQNSKPEYADERIQHLDEYVKNGGKFEDFYNNMSQSISYDDLDVENETDQKLAVRDYLKLQGYTEEQISKKIQRYEDADVLEDEASDAIERLKEIKQLELEETQRQQQQYAERQRQSAIQFVSDLNNKISNITSIRGVQIPKQDRKLLFDYITKVDANGMTQYQKDFNKNMINNLIESAYFTMKGDQLINEATKTGQTNAVNKLRKTLKHQFKNHSTYNTQEEKQRSLIDLASKWI